MHCHILIVFPNACVSVFEQGKFQDTVFADVAFDVSSECQRNFYSSGANDQASSSERARLSSILPRSREVLTGVLSRSVV